MDYDTKGTHVIADFFEVENRALLDSEQGSINLCLEAIKKANAELLFIKAHKFEPQGLTIVAIVSESSLDMHTYPEHNYASVSFHTCGTKADPIKGIEYIKEVLGSKRANIMLINRGDINLNYKQL